MNNVYIQIKELTYFFKERFQMMESNAEEKQDNPNGHTHTHTHTQEIKNKTEQRNAAWWRPILLLLCEYSWIIAIYMYTV